MISGGSLERGARVEEERKVDGVTRRKGRRGRREERGRGKGRRERGPSYWGTGKGGASDFFLAMHWVLGGSQASLERHEADHEGPCA